MQKAAKDIFEKPYQETEESNFDEDTVDAFTDQWIRFQHRPLDMDENDFLTGRFFSLFPWDEVDAKKMKGFEVGCGIGRMADWLAPRVGHLTCTDASPEAIRVSQRRLDKYDNIEFRNEPVGALTLEEEAYDFGYSYGVLMCVPNTQEAIQECAKRIKPGGPFLLYMYYSLDNRPTWYRAVWKVSDWLRKGIAALPMGPRSFVSDLIAYVVYWPLARGAKLGEKMGFNVDNWLLSDYRDGTMTRLRNCSRDRWGTPLEYRFSRAEIEEMMHNAGFENVKFLESMPYWCCVGFKKKS